MHFWDVDGRRWRPGEDENASVVSFEAKYSSVVKFVVSLLFTIIAHHVKAHHRKPHSRNVLFSGFYVSVANIGPFASEGSTFTVRRQKCVAIDLWNMKIPVL